MPTTSVAELSRLQFAKEKGARTGKCFSPAPLPQLDTTRSSNPGAPHASLQRPALVFNEIPPVQIQPLPVERTTLVAGSAPPLDVLLRGLAFVLIVAALVLLANWLHTRRRARARQSQLRAQLFAIRASLQSPIGHWSNAAASLAAALRDASAVTDEQLADMRDPSLAERCTAIAAAARTEVAPVISCISAAAETAADACSDGAYIGTSAAGTARTLTSGDIPTMDPRDASATATSAAAVADALFSVLVDASLFKRCCNCCTIEENRRFVNIALLTPSGAATEACDDSVINAVSAGTRASARTHTTSTCASTEHAAQGASSHTHSPGNAPGAATSTCVCPLVAAARELSLDLHRAKQALCARLRDVAVFEAFRLSFFDSSAASTLSSGGAVAVSTAANPAARNGENSSLGAAELRTTALRAAHHSIAVAAGGVFVESSSNITRSVKASTGLDTLGVVGNAPTETGARFLHAFESAISKHSMLRSSADVAAAVSSSSSAFSSSSSASAGALFGAFFGRRPTSTSDRRPTLTSDSAVHTLIEAATAACRVAKEVHAALQMLESCLHSQQQQQQQESFNLASNSEPSSPRDSSAHVQRNFNLGSVTTTALHSDSGSSELEQRHLFDAISHAKALLEALTKITSGGTSSRSNVNLNEDAAADLSNCNLSNSVRAPPNLNSPSNFNSPPALISSPNLNVGPPPAFMLRYLMALISSAEARLSSLKRSAALHALHEHTAELSNQLMMLGDGPSAAAAGAFSASSVLFSDMSEAGVAAALGLTDALSSSSSSATALSSQQMLIVPGDADFNYESGANCDNDDTAACDYDDDGDAAAALYTSTLSSHGTCFADSFDNTSTTTRTTTGDEAAIVACGESMQHQLRRRRRGVPSTTTTTTAAATSTSTLPSNARSSRHLHASDPNFSLGFAVALSDRSNWQQHALAAARDALKLRRTHELQLRRDALAEERRIRAEAQREATATSTWNAALTALISAQSASVAAVCKTLTSSQGEVMRADNARAALAHAETTVQLQLGAAAAHVSELRAWAMWLGACMLASSALVALRDSLACARLATLQALVTSGAVRVLAAVSRFFAFAGGASGNGNSAAAAAVEEGSWWWSSSTWFFSTLLPVSLPLPPSNLLTALSGALSRASDFVIDVIVLLLLCATLFAWVAAPARVTRRLQQLAIVSFVFWIVHAGQTRLSATALIYLIVVHALAGCVYFYAGVSGLQEVGSDGAPSTSTSNSLSDMMMITSSTCCRRKFKLSSETPQPRHQLSRRNAVPAAYYRSDASSSAGRAALVTAEAEAVLLRIQTLASTSTSSGAQAPASTSTSDAGQTSTLIAPAHYSPRYYRCRLRMVLFAWFLLSVLMGYWVVRRRVNE